MHASENHFLLICTVGGTPEPLVRTLLHWQPQRVLFVPSEQTRVQVDAVLRAFAEAERRCRRRSRAFDVPAGPGRSDRRLLGRICQVCQTRPGPGYIGCA